MSLLVGACVGVDGADFEEGIEEDVGVVRAALNDAPRFSTNHGAQVAVTEATDHINTAWVGMVDGVTQIVGEAFSNTTGQPFGTPPAPGSLIYTTNSRTKSNPSIAWDHQDSYTALIAWQEVVSSSDNNIRGQIVGDDGRTQGSNFTISSTGQTFRERSPWVIVVPTPQGNKWLVTYTRRYPVGGSFAVALSTTLVSTGGTPEAFRDVVASGVSESASRPTAAYDNSTGAILFTWNDNKFVFVNSVSDYTYREPIQTVNGANGIVAASNEFMGSYAVAYRVGSGTSATIHGRPFRWGCSALSCSPDTTVISAGGSITNLTNPVIAPVGTAFAIYSGKTLSNNAVGRITLAKMDDFGAVVQTVTNVNPACSQALQGTIGSPSTMAAATKRGESEDRTFLIYGSFCNTRNRIVGSGRLPDITQNLAFNVSD
ncbi:MAG TPA: hypothetical protein VHO25_14405 [Polyangiaceae bacterium]|nr:hypothetical protein [Polyangiaceae bacterium]